MSKLNKEWIIWFQDGGGRILVTSIEQLKREGLRFGFDADEVLRNGAVDFIDEDGAIIGGVFND